MKYDFLLIIIALTIIMGSCSQVTDNAKTVIFGDSIYLANVPPQPGEAFNNHDIAFLLARYGLNIELIDTEEKAGIF